MFFVWVLIETTLQVRDRSAGLHIAQSERPLTQLRNSRRWARFTGMDEPQSSNSESAHKDTLVAASAYYFADFCFSPETNELKKGGEAVALKLQPARLLSILLRHAPNMVLRTTIYDELWDAGTTVEFDQNLNACIRQLRSALGDSATSPEFIETLPKRGYRFIAPIKSGRAPTKIQLISGGALFVAAMIGVFAFFSSANAPEGASPRLYVAPIEFVDAAPGLQPSLFQYGLRLGVIDQLTRHGGSDLLTVNGETLWADEQLLQLTQATDYRLAISVYEDGGAYHAEAKLLKEGGDAPSSERAFPIQTTDSGGLSDASRAIAQWAVSSLGSSLSVDHTETRNADPKYFDAIIKAKRARQLGDHASLRESLEWGEKALAIDPASTQAKGVIAIALVKLAGSGEFPSDETYARAIKYADEIRSTRGPTAESELVRGFIALYHEWNLPKAENAFNLALELAPGNVLVHSWRAGFLAAIGEVKKAAAEADMAVQLDPLSMAIVSDRCWYLSAARRFEEAVDACAWAIELAPDQSWSSIGLAVALEKLGRDEEALNVLAPMVAILRARGQAGNSGASPPTAAQEEAPADLRAAQCALADLLAPRNARGDFPSFDLAAFHAQCGRMEEAAKLLKNALQHGESGALFYTIDPRFDSFRASPQADEIDMTISIRQSV